MPPTARRIHLSDRPGRRVGAPLVAALVASAPLAAQCVEECLAIHTLDGEAAGEQFGWVSNDVGDLDGDGACDFVLTAPTADIGGTNTGRFVVHSGMTGAELFRVDGAIVNGWLGHDAGSAGDFDGDGIEDVIAGAPFGGTGRAIVCSGVDGTILMTFAGESAGDQFGFRVGGRGDFDGDGVDDVIIGAPNDDDAGTDAGRAFVYSGGAGALLAAIDGPGAGANFGSGVCFVGDVNGDGLDDVAIGARNAGPGAVGRAYVYGLVVGPTGTPAPTRLRTLAPDAGALDFGQWFMNGGHDVDADGRPDIYVNDYQRNRAYVFSGRTGDRLHTFTGDGNGQFGIGRIVPDVDGDGHADVLLAAWVSPVGAPGAGKAFVYSGADGSVLETFTHDVAGAGFGFDANGLGDVNGDGRFDYVVTAALDNAHAGRGRVFVLAGTIDGAVARPADLNDDGRVDAADLTILLGSWGPCAGCDADLDGDGVVDAADLTVLLGSWD